MNRLWITARGCILALAALVGCGGGSLDDGGAPPASDADASVVEVGVDAGADVRADAGIDAGEVCFPVESVFAREVYAGVLQPSCQGCHNTLGVAAGTDFVLVEPNGHADHLQQNLAIARSIAARSHPDRPELSLMLAKPSGAVAHGGGALLEEGGARYEALAHFLERLDAEQACEIEDPSGGEERLELMSDVDAFRRAALILGARKPTQAEEAALKDGSLTLADAIAPILESEAFVLQLGEGLNDVHQLNGALLAPERLDPVAYPDRLWFEEEFAGDATREQVARSHTSLGLQRAPSELIKHVVRSRRPFSEVLTADYVMVNYASARSYGVSDLISFSSDPPRFNEFVPVRLPPVAGQGAGAMSFPHAGILTTASFLNKFLDTPTNGQRARSRAVFDIFLATNVLELAPRGGGDSAAVAEVELPTKNASECSVCHAVIEPVAGAFQNFSFIGRYRPQPGGWPEEMYPAGFALGDELPQARVGDAARWLGERVALDDRFPRAIVRMVYVWLFGREPLQIPLDAGRPGFAGALDAYNAQRARLAAIERRFESSEEIRDVVRALVLSPDFRAAGVEGGAPIDADDAERMSAFGLTRRLTPRELTLRVNRTFGSPWLYNSLDGIYDTRRFGLLLGDINSITVTERILDYNGAIASLTSHFASDVACRKALDDFARAPAARQLFKGVELGQTARSHPGEVRAAIAHLYAYVLGEDRDPDSADVDVMFDLFDEVQRNGAAAIAQGREQARLLDACAIDPPAGAPPAAPVRDDPDYTARAWMAVVTAMIEDYSFLNH